MVAAAALLPLFALCPPFRIGAFGVTTPMRRPQVVRCIGPALRDRFYMVNLKVSGIGDRPIAKLANPAVAPCNDSAQPFPSRGHVSPAIANIVGGAPLYLMVSASAPLDDNVAPGLRTKRFQSLIFLMPGLFISLRTALATTASCARFSIAFCHSTMVSR